MRSGGVWVVVSAAAVALVAPSSLVPRLGTEFVPVMDEGAFDMDVQLIPGVSLEQAMKTAGEVEERLKRFPELETVVSRTGQTGVAIEARGVDKTGFVGVLKPRSEVDQCRLARGADREDARLAGGHPRDGVQLQPADSVPHR